MTKSTYSLAHVELLVLLMLCIKHSTATAARHLVRGIFTVPVLECDLKVGIPPLYTPEQWQLLRRHHQSTVNTLNAHIANEPKFENQPLEQVVKAARFDATQRAVYSYASQHWNMCFFMRCLRDPTDNVVQADGPLLENEVEYLDVPCLPPSLLHPPYADRFSFLPPSPPSFRLSVRRPSLPHFSPSPRMQD